MSIVLHPFPPPASGEPLTRRASYRIQLRQGVTFDRVGELAPYLEALGISDCYLSPPFLARPGSTHGYDVCDPTRFDPVLGDQQQFERMARRLARHGIQVLLDIVPNHMATDPDCNSRWRDVLRHGPVSLHAPTFDIDWTAPARPELRGRVLLPMLDRPYGEALRGGALVVDPDQPILRVGASTLPLSSVEGDPSQLNGTVGEDESFAPLHALLERQVYRLAHWPAASDDVNYRRFFNVEHLVGVRVDEPAVFDDTHQLIRTLIERGLVSGLRVDHVDGLADPRAYLTGLAGWSGSRRVYLLVEKILGEGESLRSDWPVDGTTGYEFLNAVTRLFVPGRQRARLDAIYRRFTGARRSFQAVARTSRALIIDDAFTADVDLLTERLLREAEQDWDTRDLTRRGLRRGVIAMLTAMPVYRTYVTPAGASAVDQAMIAAASANAAADVDAEAELAFLCGILVQPSTPARWRIVQRFQQLSSAVFAKAVEDTAFYRHNTLLALNEVGGNPSRADSAIHAFHRLNRERARGRAGLSTTATHDTKLGEDARMRVAALSEYLDEWDRLLGVWRQRTSARHGTRGVGRPDRHDEYRCYQALVAAWPPNALDADPGQDFVGRLQRYLVKAAREGRRRTTWKRPNADYEAALDRFVADLMGDSTFLASARPFIATVARAAAVLSLAQLVLKATAPGICDFYQGTETWDHHLVDPDNRQPPDFDTLAGRLAALDREDADGTDFTARALIEAWLDAWTDGRIKLFVMRQSLAARSRHADLFSAGRYVGIRGEGLGRHPIVAFARVLNGTAAITIAPRSVRSRISADGWPLGPVWQDAPLLRVPAQVPAGRYRDALTGSTVDVARGGWVAVSTALVTLPVAILIGPEGSPRQRASAG